MPMPSHNTLGPPEGQTDQDNPEPQRDPELKWQTWPANRTPVRSSRAKNMMEPRD